MNQTKIIKLIAVISSILLLLNASPWEGAAAMAPDGELPASGMFVATNSFPINTVVDITNIETNKSTRVIVAKGLDSPGLLAVVSQEAASLIGMREGSISRLRMVQPTDPIAYFRFIEGQAAGIPAYDSGNVITEENYRNELPLNNEIISGLPSISLPPVAHSGITGPSYVLEPEWRIRGEALTSAPSYSETVREAPMPFNPVLEEFVAEKPIIIAEVGQVIINESEIITEGFCEECGKILAYADEAPLEEKYIAEAPIEAYEEIIRAEFRDEFDYITEKICPECEEAKTARIDEAPFEEEYIAEGLLEEKYTAEELIEEPLLKEEYIAEELNEEPLEENFIAEGPVLESFEGEYITEEYLTDKLIEEPFLEEYITEKPIEELYLDELIAEEYIAEKPFEESYAEEKPEFITEYSMVPADERPPESVYGIDVNDILPEIAETPALVIQIPRPAVADTASFSVPRVTELARGSYYVQLAAMDNPELVERTLSEIDRSYNPLILREADQKYRILLGPMNQGESAAVLARFKSIGYRDAFVRHAR